MIFSKIHGDIRKSRCTTGINDTSGKFSAANLPLVSTTPVANCHRYQQQQWQRMGTIIKLLTT
jgi:hypothetical protein